MFQALAFAHHNLRFFGVRPQVRISNLLLHFG
jgi:hypothetical protein